MRVIEKYYIVVTLIPDSSIVEAMKTKGPGCKEVKAEERRLKDFLTRELSHEPITKVKSVVAQIEESWPAQK